MKSNNIYNKILAFALTLITVFNSFVLDVPFTQAAFNREINYQGKLADSSDNPVADGTYETEFKIYTQSVGGSPLWTETRSGGNEVQVTNGLFSVMLGSVTPLTGIDYNQTLY